MKKQYIKPSADVILLNIESQILAGSADTNASSVGLSSTEVDNGSAYSRSFDFDDEED